MSATRPDGQLRLSWRIGLPYLESERAFSRLLKVLGQHRSVVDEVAAFDTITHHLYTPLDVYARRMELMARRLDAFRDAGIPSVGLNVLCTIGHMNEAWSCMPRLPFQPMVGHDGSISKGCACPNTPAMRAYVRAKYTLAAKARPDFIWVDDDIRMQHHGVTWGCFCKTCLGIFAKKTTRKYSRPKLVQAFDQPAHARLREAWVEQNAETLESLMADIAAAIQAVDRRIATGLMTCGPGWTTYSGQAFDRWLTALNATKARPGGGFYSDATPLEMYRKAVDSGWQRASLPPKVTDVQYELENFPYQLLKKSATAVVSECTASLAFGLNGVAFNMLAMAPAHEDFLPYLRRLPAARPLWEEWVAHTKGLPTAGLWPAWSSHLMARRAVRPGEHWLGWDGRYDISRPKTLGEIGLPLATDTPGCGTVLCGRVAEAFSDCELKEMLRGGVLMDSMTLDVLTERGLGQLTGVRMASRLDNGLIERFTGDALNGAAAGLFRDSRIEFWGDARGLGDILEPRTGVRILARGEDYFHRDQGPCMTAFQNPLGGRVVVMGYAPWIFLHSVSKRAQLQNVADWISRGKMPVRIDEPVPLIPIVRLSPDRRKGAVLLLNAGMDEVREATVHLRAACERVRVLLPGRRERRVRTVEAESGRRVTLKDLPPWSFAMMLF
jgi:hypothetical protein